MTDEQINQRIAEACPDKFRTENGVWFFQYDKDCWSQCHNNSTCTDLNAMHEAEKMLHPSQTTSMRHWLEALCKKRKLGNFWQAPARERAEAFLRVLDKWEEVQG